MKVVINLSNIVIDIKNLAMLDKLLEGAEKQDYDYTDGQAIYYIHDLPQGMINSNLIPNDLYAAQKLLGTLTAEERKKK